MSGIRPWTVVASRTLVDDRWLRLRADTCRTADGHEIAPYYVSGHDDWVHVIALDDQDRVLLVEQYRHAAGVVSLELPGGCIDAADADPVAAAARELLEETGCAGDRAELIVTLAPNPATQTNRCHAVLVRGVRQVAAPADDPGEEIVSRWVPIDTAVALAMRGEMIQAMHVAALAVTLGRLGRWRA